MRKLQYWSAQSSKVSATDFRYAGRTAASCASVGPDRPSTDHYGTLILPSQHLRAASLRMSGTVPRLFHSFTHSPLFSLFFALYHYTVYPSEFIGRSRAELRRIFRVQGERERTLVWCLVLTRNAPKDTVETHTDLARSQSRSCSSAVVSKHSGSFYKRRSHGQQLKRGGGGGGGGGGLSRVRAFEMVTFLPDTHFSSRTCCMYVDIASR